MNILSSDGPCKDTIELDALEYGVLEPDDTALLTLARMGWRPEPDMGFLVASTHNVNKLQKVGYGMQHTEWGLPS